MAAKKQPAKRTALQSRGPAVKGKKQTKAAKKVQPKAKRPVAKARPKVQQAKGSKAKVLNVWYYDAQGNR